ncbi:MAG: pentapeptide repeat-containing protein, partial [Myxococcales bacterium]|nr:pentapeptide repeat-containing protein [Myxococcales bacterium]
MADLREADLSGATLRGVDFTEALLDGAQLDGCDLSHATVRSIQMEAASWRTVIIHGQKFVRESVRRGEQVLPFEAAQAKKVRRIGLRRTEDRSQVAVSAINTLLARERYDQPGELFDKRSTHLMRLCDDAAQSTHLLYEYLNCVAAGLVSRPEHMPGQIFDFAPWKKGHIEVERPDFYFSTNQPEVLQLEVTPPPLLYAAFHGDMDKLVYSMQRLAEQGGRELRAKQRKPVLGARAITRLHPWNEPRTLRETRGQRVPTFRIGTRGIVGQEQHIEAAVETRTFRQSYRAVLDSYRAGQPEPPFPFGTYQMRVEHGAAVTEPPELGTAIVTRPGLTLRDVQAQLEQRVDSGEQADNSHARMQLTEDTREALREQAQDICDHAAGGMDLGGGQRATAVPSDGIPALFLKEVPDDRRAALRKDVAFSRVEFRKAGKRVNGFLMVARDPDYDRSHAGVCEVQPNCSLKEDGVQIAPRGVIEEAFVADSHPSEKKSLLFTGVFEEDHRNQNGLRLWTAYDLDDPLPQWTTELYT